MEGQKTAVNQTEAEAQNSVHRGHHKDKGIAVFTSGGDAQGIKLLHHSIIGHFLSF